MIEWQDDFFKLYKRFLLSDSHKSLLIGRERGIIKDFFIYYLGIKSFSKKNKKDLSKNVTLYFKKMEEIYCIKHIPYQYKNSLSGTKAYDKDIKNSTKVLQNAVRCYIAWRKILKNEDVISIAKRNIIDRIQYYFAIQQEQIERLFERQNKGKEQGIVIPRQVLIEFHNAISHLIQAGEGRKGDNIQRACNHFKRGALDLYKIIIKDFFILYPLQCQQNTKEIQDKLFKIRVREYELIGDDEARASNAKFMDNNKVGNTAHTLFDEYNNLAQDIIGFYSSQFSPNNSPQ